MNPSLNLLERGYLAGIIDGEGSLILASHRMRGVSVQIRVTSTSKELLDYLKSSLGGSTYSVHHKDRPTWSNYGIWALTKRESIKNLLEQVMPYMIIKKDHAKAVLKWIELRKNHVNGKPISQEELDLITLVRDLNHKPVRV